MSVRRRHRHHAESGDRDGDGDDEDEMHAATESTAFLAHAHTQEQQRRREKQARPAPQPPRQHNATLAARYNETMAQARAYHHPPILPRILLVVLVGLLLWTASRLQLHARTEVRKWRYAEDVRLGRIDPAEFEEEAGLEGLDPWDAYEAGSPSVWDSLGFSDGGTF